MTTRTRLSLFLFGLFVALYILPLGVRPLMEPDETRYGEVPREMIASGDWIAPRLNGVRYFEKPPLGYWLNGLSLLACGENEFAIRLPSALSAGLSALLLMLLVRRSCRPDEVWAGPLAALILLTSVQVVAMGTFAVLDSMLAAALTLTLVCLFLASREDRGSSRRTLFLVAAGVGGGLAFLTKGFLALVVPALAMGSYLVWERRWRDMVGLAWLPLVVATLTALPWGLAIHSQEADFWHYFFWTEHIQRFLGGEKAQHAESFWYFFLAAPPMFLPWTFVVPAAAIGLWRTTPQTASRPLIRFCLCWFALPFLFFSLSSGKLLTYILPCFPPLAVLTSLGLRAGVSTAKDTAFGVGARAMALLFALLAMALLLVQTVGVAGVAPPYTRSWQWLLGFAGLLAMALLSLAAHRAGSAGRKLILFGLSPALFFGVAGFIMPDQVITKKSPGALLLRQREGISPATVVLSDEDTVRAVCWYLKRADVLLVGAAGELNYGLRYAEARGRKLDLPGAKATILANPGKIVLVARARNYRRFSAVLPPPQTIADSGQDGYVLARY